MKTLENLLLHLGFEEAQAKVYAEVYFHGPVTVLEIASMTGIKRPTVHFHVEQLLEKKLLKASVRKGRRVVVAESPEAFVTLVEKHREEVQKMEHSLGRVIDETHAVTDRQSVRGISVLVDEGIHAVVSLYKSALQYGEVYSYIDVERSSEIIDMRKPLFDESLLAKRLEVFSEKYVTRENKIPLYVQRLSVFAPFTFQRTMVKIPGNVANILLFAQSVVMITRETEWKVMTLEQPLLVQFIKGLLQE